MGFQHQVDKQKELYTKVYPLCEMLGWYSVGLDVTEADMVIHREMMKYNETPYFLLMNPEPDPDAKELPVQVDRSLRGLLCVQSGVNPNHFLTT
jgi:COP9 signalosome complex subunit 6